MAGQLEPSDSIRLSSSGFMHLRVLSERIEYIIGVLPSTPIFDRRFATRVADRVKVENERGSIPYHARGELARGFQKYLSEQAASVSKVVQNFAAEQTGVSYILRQIERAIEYFDSRKGGQNEENELDY